MDEKNGTRINGWNITLTNITNPSIVYFNITYTHPTNGIGYYNITGVPYGQYWLNETPKLGWAQHPTTPNRTVEINATTPSLVNQNFINIRGEVVADGADDQV